MYISVGYMVENVNASYQPRKNIMARSLCDQISYKIPDIKTGAKNPHTIRDCFINNYFLTLSATDKSFKEKKKSYDKIYASTWDGYAKWSILPMYGPFTSNFYIN